MIFCIYLDNPNATQPHDLISDFFMFYQSQQPFVGQPEKRQFHGACDHTDILGYTTSNVLPVPIDRRDAVGKMSEGGIDLCQARIVYHGKWKDYLSGLFNDLFRPDIPGLSIHVPHLGHTLAMDQVRNPDEWPIITNMVSELYSFHKRQFDACVDRLAILRAESALKSGNTGSAGL